MRYEQYRYLLLLLLLFNRSLARVDFPNHDVVVFQPHTGDTPGLDSISIGKPY